MLAWLDAYMLKMLPMYMEILYCDMLQFTDGIDRIV